ncbi:hypothetical protein O181_056151 [Austropuccinia psidii MF-1]|uniref:DUF7872 domain-containing protein n=1 Tax=Austropuccinia psidii MF-1 TaxID=1389203 RepID=A0A9Q3E5S9_9BASI|nr:hypothetical protein [Austropuccinia psidii MF-1]
MIGDILLLETSSTQARLVYLHKDSGMSHFTLYLISYWQLYEYQVRMIQDALLGSFSKRSIECMEHPLRLAVTITQKFNGLLFEYTASYALYRSSYQIFSSLGLTALKLPHPTMPQRLGSKSHAPFIITFFLVFYGKQVCCRNVFSANPSNLAQPVRSTSPTISLPNNPINALPPRPEQCGVYPLNQTTWAHFGWDNYLATYPNGSSLIVQEYAASKGAKNFKCGIGENCNIGQLCSPVAAPDWYILYAAQHLNTYLNTLYDTAGEAISFSQSTLSSVWNDLYPALISHVDLWAVFTLGSAAAVTQVVGALFLLFIPDVALLFLFPVSPLAIISVTFVEIMLASLIAVLVGEAILSQHDMSSPVQSRRFESLTSMSYPLARWQEATQNTIANYTQKIFTSGISGSNCSLSEILKNGTFLSPFERKNSFELNTDLKNVTATLAVAKLLRAMNAFITISDDPHPNKFWRSKNVLSYHSPNGTLMNIIRTVPKETKAINDFDNAHVLSEKYGITTEHIVAVSWDCQQRFGMQSRNMTENRSRITAFVNDATVCSFDLPVCDLRNSEAQKRKEKGERTVKICRDFLGLPI